MVPPLWRLPEQFGFPSTAPGFPLRKGGFKMSRFAPAGNEWEHSASERALRFPIKAEFLTAAVELSA
jgi:hypothetical protein